MFFSQWICAKSDAFSYCRYAIRVTWTGAMQGFGTIFDMPVPAMISF
jgi:hypothetical protein